MKFLEKSDCMLKYITSLKIKNYKGIGLQEPEGFVQVSPVNLLIGKNNVGKTSLVDIFKMIWDESYWKDKKFDEILVSFNVTEELFEEFLSDVGRIGLNDEDSSDFRENITNEEIVVKIDRPLSTNPQASGKEFIRALNTISEDFVNYYKYELDQMVTNFLKNIGKRTVTSLNAERNISSEQDNSNIELKANGTGATNLIHKYINKDNLNHLLINKELLNSLNEIFKPDSIFQDIIVQQISDDPNIEWEVFLEEKDGKRISLSNSGSGLKTVILVLLQLIVIPDILDKEPGDLIYIFEEIENNLHPSLQRNLFSFIDRWVREHNCYTFITTHSHVPIELFSTNKNAQLMHVKKTETGLVSNSVFDHETSKAAIDDLGIKASDILQSNGIIWVEGPSDRIFLNHWIEVYTSGNLIENRDYQIIFYGGKLLAHYATIEENYENDKPFISLLKTNKNCAIIIDSDKDDEDSIINSTKQRIKNEMMEMDSLCWITEGREIENYLPSNIIQEFYDKRSERAFGKFERIEEYLREIHENPERNYYKPKVPKAIKLSNELSYDILKDQLDWKEKMEELVKRICSWNHYNYEGFLRE